jgi:hypothetical protein
MAETQIAGRQIKDASIENAKIAAGAAIASSKLADGANFIKKDGSVAFTGAISLGNQYLTNVASPQNSGDGANKSYVDTLINNLSTLYKYRTVHAASTANVLIGAPSNSLDGHTLVNGDRVLIKNQTTTSENGIYIYNGLGYALTRAADSDIYSEITGSLVYVENGTTLADTRFFCTSNTGGTIGSTAITYVQDTGVGITSANFVVEEIPSGSLNGSNVTYTLAFTPVSGKLKLFLNGIRLRSGAGNDYTISTATITMATAPTSNDVLIADYIK